MMTRVVGSRQLILLSTLLHGDVLPSGSHPGGDGVDDSGPSSGKRASHGAFPAPQRRRGGLSKICPLPAARQHRCPARPPSWNASVFVTLHARSFALNCLRVGIFLAASCWRLGAESSLPTFRPHARSRGVGAEPHIHAQRAEALCSRKRATRPRLASPQIQPQIWCGGSAGRRRRPGATRASCPTHPGRSISITLALVGPGVESWRRRCSSCAVPSGVPAPARARPRTTRRTDACATSAW
jgi:hypothetical protein